MVTRIFVGFLKLRPNVIDFLLFVPKKTAECKALGSSNPQSGHSLDQQTAEHFAQTINQLKGKVTMLFITHALPKTLMVDEVARIGR